MEWAKPIVAEYGIAGLLLSGWAWFIYTIVKEFLPARQARGDAVVDRFVDAVTKAREEERGDRREDRKEASDLLMMMMNQQIEERRRERAEFYSVMDRLDRTIVRLSAKIDAFFPDEPDPVVSAVPNPNLQPAGKP